MSVTSMKLRLNQAGAELVGPANGDQLRWNSTTRQWEAFTFTPPTVETAFDFILEDRADLVAAVGPPVGTDFQMVSGSYALKQGFTIDPTERLFFPNGAAILMVGMGSGKELSGSPGSGNALAEFETGTVVDLIGLSLTALGNGSDAVIVHGATLRTYGCRFRANATGGTAAIIDNADGIWLDFGSRFESQSDNFVILGGQPNFTGSRFIGGVGPCIDASAPSLDVRAKFSLCDFDGGTVSAIQHSATNGDLFFVDCTVRSNNNGVDCVSLNGGSSFQWIGGNIVSTAGTPGDGIRFNGDMTGGSQIIGPTFDNLDDAIQYQAGTQRRVTIVGCDSATNVAVGVDWPSANIPTSCLLVVGNQFDTATPFQNFIETDARVNRKANSFAATLSSETPIVP